jgi:protein-arginine kinase activator protein McsA
LKRASTMNLANLCETCYQSGKNYIISSQNKESIENLVSNNVGFSKLNHYVYVSCNCVPYTCETYMWLAAYNKFLN